jgi:hypothetical protein
MARSSLAPFRSGFGMLGSGDPVSLHPGREEARTQGREGDLPGRRALLRPFRRSLRPPFPVDPGQVRASFENRALAVTVPKTRRQEHWHRIEVQGRAASGQSSQGSGADRAPPAPEMADHA